jgi:nitrite reductase/ring-hydroxylating ferredoxin subunit
MSFRSVMRAEELWGGEMVGLSVDGCPVLLLKIDGEVRAYEDRCAHRGWPLSRGKLCGNVLTCGAHEWAYDACTGRGINPDGIALRAIPVRVDGGNIEVDVDDP